MKYLSFILVLFIPALLKAQYQVKKGRWSVNHNIGGYSHETLKSKAYDGTILESDFKTTNSGFKLLFKGPDWGVLRAGGNTYTNNISGDPARRYADFGFRINPELGYFIKDGWLIGGNLDIDISSYRSKEYQGRKSIERQSSFGLGPLLKYYPGKSAKSRPFIGFRATYLLGSALRKITDASTTDIEVSKSKSTWDVWNINPFAGYAWFIRKRWTAELSAEWMYEKENSDQKDYSYINDVLEPGYPFIRTNKSTWSTISLNIGISYTF